MVPNFDTKHWDREKIIDWVIGDQPLDDQQLAFLDFFDYLQQEIISLKGEIKRLKDSKE